MTPHENLKSPDLDSIASDTFLIHSGGKLRRAEAVESAIVVVPVRAVSSQHRPVFRPPFDTPRRARKTKMLLLEFEACRSIPS